MMADMSAAELYAIVKDWPEGARPPLLEYKACGGELGWFDDDSYTAVSLAVLAHVGSAVEWLMDWIDPAFLHGRDGKVHVMEMGDHPAGYGSGPTLLHALDAAVRAVKGGDDA